MSCHWNVSASATIRSRRKKFESYTLLIYSTLTDDISGMRFSVDFVVSDVSDGDDAA